MLLDVAYKEHFRSIHSLYFNRYEDFFLHLKEMYVLMNKTNKSSGRT